MKQYQVPFGSAISRAIGKYCCFTGRASRSEYWFWVLFTFIINAIIGTSQGIMIGIYGDESHIAYLCSFVLYAWSLAILLPSWGLTFRRLHDTGRSGWNVCWILLPLIGEIILLVYLCQPSQMDENKYGPVPNVVE